jgi:hypothetical protein
MISLIPPHPNVVSLIGYCESGNEVSVLFSSTNDESICILSCMRSGVVCVESVFMSSCVLVFVYRPGVVCVDLHVSWFP